MNRFLLKNKNGVSLIEVLLVVLIVAVLVGLMVTRFEKSAELARAAEALKILEALRLSQERYFFESGAYANNPNDLDVTIPVPNHFNTVVVFATCADDSPCASVNRNGNHYRLAIRRDGTITCTEGPGPVKCDDAGY